MYEKSCQSRFDAWHWMLGASALGRPRGMLWGGEEGGGFRMGSTCIPEADSFWYLEKLIQLCIGSQRVGHGWSNLACTQAVHVYLSKIMLSSLSLSLPFLPSSFTSPFLPSLPSSLPLSFNLSFLLLFYELMHLSRKTIIAHWLSIFQTMDEAKV